jgi:hypothetical protein
MKENTAMKFVRQVGGAALLAAALAVAGCTAQDKPPEPVAGAAPAAKMVTDLSSVSSATIDPLRTSAVPARGEGLLHSAGGDSSSPRTFGEEPGLTRPAGSDANPGEERLLNAKAAKFANFSQVILDRIFAQIQLAEREEEISSTKLPTDIKPVVITAIMDRSGKLTELILEQHSGRARIDQMMIAVCKKAIWYRNPPPEALSEDGNYKLTVQCKLTNYASKDEAHWSFFTSLAVGLG